MKGLLVRLAVLLLSSAGLAGTGLALQAEAATQSLHIGGLAAPGVSSGAPDRQGADKAASTAGTASADNIVIARGSTTIRIKHIDMAGTSLTSADIAALFDAKAIDTLEARLRSLNATSISIPEITGDTVDGPIEQHWVQHQLLFANVAQGRAAIGSAATGSFTIKDAKGSTKGEIGAATFKGVDFTQIAHLATARRTSDDEPYKPIYDEIAVSAVKLSSPGANQPLTIGTIKERGVKARAFKTDLAAASAKLADEAPDNAEANAIVGDIVQSFQVEAIEADDFALVQAFGDNPNELKTFALKHVAFHDFGAGRLGRFELSGFVVDGTNPQPFHVALGSAAFDGLTFVPSSKAAGEAVPSKPTAAVDKIDFHDLAVDVTAAEKNKPAQRFAFTLAHAGYDAPGLVIGHIPPKATLSLDHLAFDVMPTSQAAPMLLAMGYKHLDMSGSSTSTYDAAKQTLDLDRLTVDAAGMAGVDLKLGLSNVTEGIVSQNDTIQKASALALVMRNVDLSIRNVGLIDKAIAFKAAIDGLTLEQERENLIAGAVSLPSMIGNPPKLAVVSAAVSKFLAAPKTLHIAISSKTGFGAASLGLVNDPNALLDTLDIAATADE